MRACDKYYTLKTCGIDGTSRDALAEVEEGQRLQEGCNSTTQLVEKFATTFWIGQHWKQLLCYVTVFYSVFLALKLFVRSHVLCIQKNASAEKKVVLCLKNRTFHLSMYIKSQKSCVALLQYRAFSKSLNIVISLL